MKCGLRDMGICTRRNLVLTVCVLQLISTLERQVFDFLGYMWAPILANFFNIIFVIFGCFGAFQCRRTYILTYALWVLLWLGWNVFVICFYLNVGVLDRDSDVLNLGTGSVSWWEVNGSGCKPSYPTNLTVAEDPDPFRPLRPEHVTGCFMNYQYVEVLHAAVQCVLAVVGCLCGVSLSHKILDEDDDLSIKLRSKRNGSSGNRTSLYSIQINPRDSTRGDNMEFEDNIESHLSAPQLSPRPMTPRRVKRRSVISRGTTATSSLPHCHDKRSSVRYNNARSSLRASNRRPKLQHQNPVTRLIEQQQQSLADSSTSNDSTRLNIFDPSSSSQADLLSNTSTSAWKKSTGHTNPLYQQNSVQSLNDDDDEDDVYNNRPSSARSSYSNYHGARSISCYGGSPAYYMSGQATAQVPVANTHRQAYSKSRPTSAFLSSGPPAYQVQGVVDSETVI